MLDEEIAKVYKGKKITKGMSCRAELSDGVAYIYANSS